MKIATIVGARPQFIKAAVVSRALETRRAAGVDPPIDELFVHTGQHFDPAMSDVFFDELDLPRPDVHLGISGGTHGRMTGRMLEAIERVLIDRAPDWVLVYGDANSTLAGALAAAKLGLPLAHVESGLRSFDRRMPEEINRVATDHLASLLFAPTDAAVANLAREGVDGARIVRTGDVMYDAMLFYRDRARERSRIVETLGLEPKRFVLATVHRAGNTDDPERLLGIVEGLARLARSLDVVVPLHPRTRAALDDAGLVDAAAGVRLVEPVGYLDMVRLESAAALVATDSGGVQKEAYFHRVPCITLRDETEWTELVEIGANTLVGTDPDRIASAGLAALERPVPDRPLYGDGDAAATIVEELARRGAGTPAHSLAP